MLLWNQGRTIAKTVDQGKIQGLPFLCPIRLHCCTNYNAPTGALDTNTGLAVMHLFKELIEKENVTIVMTTHDTNLMELGDVVYEMEDGMIGR